MLVAGPAPRTSPRATARVRPYYIRVEQTVHWCIGGRIFVVVLLFCPFAFSCHLTAKSKALAFVIASGEYGKSLVVFI
jgi:hypothetical protein